MKCCAQESDACSYSCCHRRAFRSDCMDWAVEWELGTSIARTAPCYHVALPYSSGFPLHFVVASGKNDHSPF